MEVSGFTTQSVDSGIALDMKRIASQRWSKVQVFMFLTFGYDLSENLVHQLLDSSMMNLLHSSNWDDERDIPAMSGMLFGELMKNLRDRKRVVWGKSVSVRVDFGGGRIIKQNI